MKKQIQNYCLAVVFLGAFTMTMSGEWTVLAMFICSGFWAGMLTPMLIESK